MMWASKKLILNHTHTHAHTLIPTAGFLLQFSFNQYLQTASFPAFSHHLLHLLPFKGAPAHPPLDAPAGIFSSSPLPFIHLFVSPAPPHCRLSTQKQSRALVHLLRARVPLIKSTRLPLPSHHHSPIPR